MDNILPDLRRALEYTLTYPNCFLLRAEASGYHGGFDVVIGYVKDDEYLYDTYKFPAIGGAEKIGTSSNLPD